MLFLLIGITFTPQKLNVDGRVIWAEAVDVNGDQGADLVVAFRRGQEAETKRFVAWYYQNPDGTYPEKPSEERAIPDDAAFADLTDCDGDGNAELLLIGAQSVSSFAAGTHIAAAPVELLRVTTAAPFPEIEDLPLWTFCQDWHARGKNDIGVWAGGTFVLFSRDGNKWSQKESIAIPPQAWVDSPASGFFRGPASNRDLSISTMYLYPKLTIGDYEGDGRADLFAVQEDRLRIFAGKADGRFSSEPTVALDFQVKNAEERKQKNSYVSAQAVDIDGDKRTDVVINKVTGGLSSMKSATLVHYNHGGFKRAADQTIKRDGFSALLQFIDLNGDGKPEMLEPSGDVGLTTLARAMVSRSLSVDWIMTPNKDGKLDTQASERIAVSFGLDFSGGPIFKGPFPKASFDYTGDGLIDFVVSSDGKELLLYAGKPGGGFEADAGLKSAIECSPFTSGFYDKRSKHANILTYFRDVPGKEGRVVVGLAR